MHNGSIATSPLRSPLPVYSATPHPHPSRLNPLSPLRSSLQPLRAISTTTSTKTHLSNLELVLRNPSPPLPQLTPVASREHQPSRRGLLKALNIPALFPFCSKPSNASEEMSPRSLTRLHHLLSDSSGPSPRNTIAARWRQYHGSHNWAGLLNPLDGNLRRELVRYGDFVGAAYHAFHSDPTVPAESHRPVSLPDRSYRVTRGLHATSSIVLPSGVQAVAPQWMTHRSSWIGYVAVCESESEIKRMGRRDIVVALRGTSTCLEWLENFRAALVPMTGPGEEDARLPHSPKVECGFWSLYKTPGTHVPSLSEAVVEEVRRLVEQYKGEQLSVTVTGHSLGAALSVLVADELGACLPRESPIAVFSFGGPRVGNRAFADRVEARGVKVLRVVNAHDMVTRVPGVLPRMLVGADGYVDVGQELRVDSRASPYLRPDADPACCHDLEAYLHLVDGYLAANCPFRSNAKRSLVRLLHQQGSNVKKLYVSNARALGLDPLDPVTPRRSAPVCLANPSTS